jgi:hypothetical protein
MQWYKITISGEEANQKLHIKIQDAFEKLFLVYAHQLGDELALLDGGWSRNNDSNIYFSPKCSEVPAFKALIDFYKGVPCNEPTRETEKEMGLLIGVQKSWEHMMWRPVL